MPRTAPVVQTDVEVRRILQPVGRRGGRVDADDIIVHIIRDIQAVSGRRNIGTCHQICVAADRGVGCRMAGRGGRIHRKEERRDAGPLGEVAVGHEVRRADLGDRRHTLGRVGDRADDGRCIDVPRLVLSRSRRSTDSIPGPCSARGGRVSASWVPVGRPNGGMFSTPGSSIAVNDLSLTYVVYVAPVSPGTSDQVRMLANAVFVACRPETAAAGGVWSVSRKPAGTMRSGSSCRCRRDPAANGSPASRLEENSSLNPPILLHLRGCHPSCRSAY